MKNDSWQDSGLGVCIKNFSGEVLFQNPACISRCGRDSISPCNKVCLKNYTASRMGISLQGISRAQDALSPSDHCEVYVVNDGQYLLTLQCPIEMKLKKFIQEVQRFHLTKTELRITEMRLKHYSNLQITKELFISKATLKTHFNNIYKKIPTALKELLLNCSTSPPVNPVGGLTLEP